MIVTGVDGHIKRAAWFYNIEWNGHMVEWTGNIRVEWLCHRMEWSYNRMHGLGCAFVLHSKSRVKLIADFNSLEMNL